MVGSVRSTLTIQFQKIYKRSTHKSSFITYAVESEEAQIRAKSIDYDWQGISFDLIINDTVADKVQLQLLGGIIFTMHWQPPHLQFKADYL